MLPTIPESMISLIAESVTMYGVEVTLVRKSSGVPVDSDEPWGPDQTDDPGTEQFTANAVEDEFELKDVDGSNVMAGDKKLVVAVDTIEDVNTGDPADGATRLEHFNQIVHAGETWGVVRILDRAKINERVISVTYQVRKRGRMATA